MRRGVAPAVPDMDPPSNNRATAPISGHDSPETGRGLATVRAERRLGVTLESEVEAWIERYLLAVAESAFPRS